MSYPRARTAELLLPGDPKRKRVRQGYQNLKIDVSRTTLTTDVTFNQEAQGAVGDTSEKKLEYICKYPTSIPSLHFLCFLSA